MLPMCLLNERLIEWGVDTIFGLPGDGINGVFEALRKNREHIRFTHVWHEESAAFMACAYAKFTGRLGVCVATSGPGGMHLLTGLLQRLCLLCRQVSVNTSLQRLRGDSSIQ